MNIAAQLINTIRTDEFSEVGLERLLTKAKASERRKQKFGEYTNGDGVRRRHWSNHAGTYKDPLRKAPKYYHSSLPPRVHRHIKSYQDLVKALKQIAAGKSNHDHYNIMSGLNRERLRYAQSQRDKGNEVRASAVARMGYEQIKR